MRLATPRDANNLSALATQVFLHTYATEGVSDDLSAYVQEHFWRKAVGTRRLEECRRLAYDRVGDPALWLSGYAGNRDAIEFYTRREFRRAGELWFELDSVAHLNFVLVQGQAADSLNT